MEYTEFDAFIDNSFKWSARFIAFDTLFDVMSSHCADLFTAKCEQCQGVGKIVCRTCHGTDFLPVGGFKTRRLNPQRWQDRLIMKEHNMSHLQDIGVIPSPTHPNYKDRLDLGRERLKPPVIPGSYESDHNDEVKKQRELIGQEIIEDLSEYNAIDQLEQSQADMVSGFEDKSHYIYEYMQKFKKPLTTGLNEEEQRILDSEQIEEEVDDDNVKRQQESQGIDKGKSKIAGDETQTEARRRKEVNEEMETIAASQPDEPTKPPSNRWSTADDQLLIVAIDNLERDPDIPQYLKDRLGFYRQFLGPIEHPWLPEAQVFQHQMKNWHEDDPYVDAEDAKPPTDVAEGMVFKALDPRPSYGFYHGHDGERRVPDWKLIWPPERVGVRMDSSGKVVVDPLDKIRYIEEFGKLIEPVTTEAERQGALRASGTSEDVDYIDAMGCSEVMGFRITQDPARKPDPRTVFMRMEFPTIEYGKVERCPKSAHPGNCDYTNEAPRVIMAKGGSWVDNCFGNLKKAKSVDEGDDLLIVGEEEGTEEEQEEEEEQEAMLDQEDADRADQRAFDKEHENEGLDALEEEVEEEKARRAAAAAAALAENTITNMSFKEEDDDDDEEDDDSNDEKSRDPDKIKISAQKMKELSEITGDEDGSEVSLNMSWLPRYMKAKLEEMAEQPENEEYSMAELYAMQREYCTRTEQDMYTLMVDYINASIQNCQGMTWHKLPCSWAPTRGTEVCPACCGNPIVGLIGLNIKKFFYHPRTLLGRFEWAEERRLDGERYRALAKRENPFKEPSNDTGYLDEEFVYPQIMSDRFTTIQRSIDTSVIQNIKELELKRPPSARMAERDTLAVTRADDMNSQKRWKNREFMAFHDEQKSVPVRFIDEYDIHRNPFEDRHSELESEVQNQLSSYTMAEEILNQTSKTAPEQHLSGYTMIGKYGDTHRLRDADEDYFQEITTCPYEINSNLTSYEPRSEYDVEEFDGIENRTEEEKEDMDELFPIPFSEDEDYEDVYDYIWEEGMEDAPTYEAKSSKGALKDLEETYYEQLSDPDEYIEDSRLEGSRDYELRKTMPSSDSVKNELKRRRYYDAARASLSKKKGDKEVEREVENAVA